MNTLIKPPCVNTSEDNTLVVICKQQEEREAELKAFYDRILPTPNQKHEQCMQEEDTTYKPSFPFVQAISGIFINTNLVPNYKDLL